MDSDFSTIALVLAAIALVLLGVLNLLIMASVINKLETISGQMDRMAMKMEGMAKNTWFHLGELGTLVQRSGCRAATSAEIEDIVRNFLEIKGEYNDGL